MFISKKMRKTISKLLAKKIILLLLLFLAFVPLITVFADDCEPACKARVAADAKNKGLQNPWPASPMSGKSLDACSTLPQLVAYFYGWAVGLGGIAVFISLVIAGLEYVTSVGSPEKMKSAFKRIESSVIGLTLLLGSYAILQLINPKITDLASNTFTSIGHSSAFKSY